MLVLTRRRNESILVGENIEITVVGLTKSTAKLGISAPLSTSISRAELLNLPIWCQSERFPNPGFCRGVSEKQITEGRLNRCRACPYCNHTLLPAT